MYGAFSSSWIVGSAGRLQRQTSTMTWCPQPCRTALSIRLARTCVVASRSQDAYAPHRKHWWRSVVPVLVPERGRVVQAAVAQGLEQRRSVRLVRESVARACRAFNVSECISA
eukprot:6174588-Pleurochrysis_carterae.AAC.2